MISDWANTEYDFSARGPQRCECGVEFATAAAAASHHHSDGPKVCMARVFVAAAKARSLMIGDTHTIFYCQVPGCFAGIAHRNYFTMTNLKEVLKHYSQSQHPGLSVVQSSLVTMLMPQPGCEELQIALNKRFLRLDVKVSSIGWDGKEAENEQTPWTVSGACLTQNCAFSCIGLVARTVAFIEM